MMKKLLLATTTLALALSMSVNMQAAERPQVQMFEIGQSVLKLSLADGVTPEDAIAAMDSKAIELNMKMVGQQNVGAEVRARGIDAPELQIFQYCRPEDAIKMVEFDTIYAAYMPCRIALVEDKDGTYWLEMLNLDMLIDSAELPPELQAIAIEINGQMLSIISAGATGDF